MSSKEPASTTGSATGNDRGRKGMANNPDTRHSSSLGAARSPGSPTKPDTKKQRKGQGTRCKIEGCIKFIQSHNEGYCRQHYNEVVKNNELAGSDDEAYALELQRQERDRYRRRGAATKVERFEPGGNPNVLDYGASSSSSTTSNGDSKQKASCSAKTEGVSKAPVPKSTTKSSKEDKHNDQEAADAAFAAQLAAMYEDPRFSSALEKVKFGGRKREAVKMFQPGGNPRETNPTEDYNLPPAPPGEDGEPSAKRPKILSRKPGRISKEEEARLMAAEEATQARLRDLMEGFNEVQQTNSTDAAHIICDDDIDEEDEIRENMQIQTSLADLLSNPRSIDMDRRQTKVSISCRPAVLDLTEEEAREAERQLSALYATNGSSSDDDIPSVGCMLSLVYGARANDSDEENKTPKIENNLEGDMGVVTVEECADIFSSIFEGYLLEDGSNDVSLFSKSAAESRSIDVSTDLFMKHYSNFPIGALVDIVGAFRELKIEPRRGYDIIDVLCEFESPLFSSIYSPANRFSS